MPKPFLTAAAAVSVLLLNASSAFAAGENTPVKLDDGQTPNHVPGASAGGSLVRTFVGHNAVQLLILLSGITLVPALLFTVTGFTRILVVLGFVRQGLGTQAAPPNQVLVGIALFLTIFVMAPTFKQIKTEAIDPLQKHKITQTQAFERGQQPLREFMFRQTRTTDLALFVKLGKVKNVKTRKDVPTYVL